MVRIAVICPLGYLDRHGYQYVYRTCIASMTAFADAVYLVQSIDSRAGINELLARYDNVDLVSDLSTYFEVEHGAPVYDMMQLEKNLNTCMDLARDEGYNIAAVVDVNQYIPESARPRLRDECNDVVSTNSPFGWLHRRDQLAGVTFHANARRPWIFNLAHDARLLIRDQTEYNGQTIEHARGNFACCDGVALVDCQLEMTPDDLRGKLEFVRFYREYRKYKPDSFDYDYWLRYSVGKFAQKQPDGASLDIYGREIATIGAARPDFVSHEVLRALNG